MISIVLTRPEMEVEIAQGPRKQGRHISYFGPRANDFENVGKTLLKKIWAKLAEKTPPNTYHTLMKRVPFNQMPGKNFTPWQDLPAKTEYIVLRRACARWRRHEACWMWPNTFESV